MPSIRLAPAAERDIRLLLHQSHESFGEAARKRYEALLAQAVKDLGDNHTRPGVAPLHALGPNYRIYHLRMTRDRVSPAARRVVNPRHFLVLRIVDSELIEVVRVLHDAMDASRHVGPEGASEE